MLLTYPILFQIVKVGNSEYLPVEIGNTYVYRDADMVTVDSPLGFLLKCNMKFHICNLELSGKFTHTEIDGISVQYQYLLLPLIKQCIC